MDSKTLRYALICAALSLLGGGTYAFCTNVLLATPCDASCDPSGDRSFRRKAWYATLCVLLIQGSTNGVALLYLDVLRPRWKRWRASPQQPVPLTAVVASAPGSARDGSGGGAGAAGLSSSSSSSSSSSTVSVLSPSMRIPMLVVTLLDVGTVFLQSAASVLIPAAINSAMRGMLLLMAGLMARSLRIGDAKAGRAEWAGIGLSSIGALGIGGIHIAAVALSPTASSFADTSTADAVLGVGLSALSNLSLAAGITYETKVFERQKPAPLALNTTRSILGSAVLVAALAIAHASPSTRDHGRFENGEHTACCVAHTPSILGFSWAVGLGASISGISALELSRVAGSNFRSLIYVARSLWVWTLQLLTYYCGSAAGDAMAPVYGTPWTTFSWPQAVGFLLLLLGGAVTWRGKERRMAAAAAAAAAVQAPDSGAASSAASGVLLCESGVMTPTEGEGKPLHPVPQGAELHLRQPAGEVPAAPLSTPQSTPVGAATPSSPSGQAATPVEQPCFSPVPLLPHRSDSPR